MSAFTVAACALVLAGCGIARIETKDLKHAGKMRSHVPPGYTAAVHFPAERGQGKYVIKDQHGRVLWVLNEGKQLKGAGREVVRSVFGKTVRFSDQSVQNVVIKIDGDLNIDLTWGGYKAVVGVKVFGKRGKLIGEATSEVQLTYGSVNDENAIFNVYATAINQALFEIFDNPRFTRRLAKIVPPSKFFPRADADLADLLDVTSSGTGFFVNTEGNLITNYHVVQECPRAYVNYGSRYVPAKLTHLDEQNDLAVLNADVDSASHARFAGDEEVQIGQQVVTLGFPLQGLLTTSPTLSTGVVSALAGPADIEELFQHTAAIQPGNSGGPVLDSSGNVVGVVAGTLNTVMFAQLTGALPQNLNFAIRRRLVVDFLARNEVTHLVRDPTDEPRETTDIAEEAEGFVVQVVCLE
ncbi:MAG: trypsin-like peptidase domain-containing protein [Deltaproteobacteria bacterium]|nr:trypsin-like peptidase domain-containing protein [Deltaproteobacteria bacterium]